MLDGCRPFFFFFFRDRVELRNETIRVLIIQLENVCFQERLTVVSLNFSKVATSNLHFKGVQRTFLLHGHLIISLHFTNEETKTPLLTLIQ